LAEAVVGLDSMSVAPGIIKPLRRVGSVIKKHLRQLGQVAEVARADLDTAISQASQMLAWNGWVCPTG
jgi:hypothetical protein